MWHWKTAVGLWIFIGLCFLFAYAVKAQHHHHPKEHAELHLRFYSTWMKPDNPQQSCCNLIDCYPTAAQYVDGVWYGKRREDGKWLRIPTEKIERNRDMPDTQAHICAPAPSNLYPPDTVFCFGIGSGT